MANLVAEVDLSPQSIQLSQTSAATSHPYSNPFSGSFPTVLDLDFTAVNTDTYSLGVSGAGNVAYSPLEAGSGSSENLGEYDLEITVGAAPELKVLSSEDPTNDTLVEAIDTRLSSANPGSFIGSGFIGDKPSVTPGLDVDQLAIQLDTGDRVTIDIDANEFGSSLDSFVRLFNSNGIELATNDDSPAPGEPRTLDSFLDFTASVSDTYFIGLSDLSSGSYDPSVAGSGSIGGTGEYNIEIVVGEDLVEVPEDQSWARFLEIAANPSSSTINYTVELNTGLGSDRETVLVDTYRE